MDKNTDMKRSANVARVERADRAAANRDPITGAPGAHPVGAGVGAAGGGATGAAIGAAVAGPVGAVAGAVIGGVAGGLAGKGVAENVNPTMEHEYWRKNYSTRPYAAETSYEQIGPAYQYGWESYEKYGTDGTTFDEASADLERGWNGARNKSKMTWMQAQAAARDAWDRTHARASGETAQQTIRDDE